MEFTHDYIEELFKNTEDSRKVILSLLEDQYFKMEELNKAKNDYVALFEESPIALWEEDFSEAKKYITENCNKLTNLSTFFDTNPAHIYNILSLVKVTNVNKACVELYKAKTKDDLLNNLSKVFTIDAVNVFKSLFQKLFTNIYELEAETINTTLSGERIHIKLKYKVVPGYEKSLERILVSIVDITKERKISDKLRESEQRYIEAQKIAKLGNWTFNHLTNEIKRSKEIYNILEIKKSETDLTFESFLQFIHKDDLIHYQNVFNQAISNKEEYEVQYRIITPSKNIKYILENGHTYYNEKNEPITSVGTAQDITKQVLVENEIKESQAEYQVLFDNAPIALFEENFTAVLKTLMELGANEHNIDSLLEDEALFQKCLKLIFVNNVNLEALKLFKAKNKEEFHKNLPNLFSKHAIEIVKEIFINITQGKSSGNYETTLKTIDGELFHALVRFSVLKYKKDSGKLLFSAENISLRKKLLAEIEEKQLNLNQAQQIALIGSFSLYHENQLIERTDEFYRIFEATPEQLPTREECFLEFVHPDDREDLINIFHDSITSKISYDFEYRIITAKGNIKYIHEKGNTTYDSNGKPIKTIGTLQDITAKTLFQLELNESREALEQTLYNMTDGFVQLDKNWVYTHVNPKAAEMFGKKIEDLIGKHIWTEFPEGIDQPFYKIYYEAFETQKPIIFEDFYTPWNRWFENRIIPSSEGISIFFQDITERKLVNQKLENAYSIINKSKSVAISWNVSEGYTIKFVTENCEQLFGYTQSELMSGNFKYDEIIFSEDKERVFSEAAYHNRIDTDDYYWHQPYRIICKDGSLKWVKDRSEIQRNKKGEIISTQGFVEDINSQYLAELELKKTDEILQNTLNTITEGFLTFDKNFIYTYANPQAALYLNKTLDELIGNSLFSIYPDSMDKNFHNHCKNVMDTKKPISFEEYYNDTNSWFLNRVFPNQEGVSIFFKNITDEKVAHKKLEQAFTIINNSKTLLYTIKNDDDLNFEFISDNAKTVLGYTADEIYKNKIKFSDLVHPDDIDIVKTSIENYIKSGNRNSYFQPIYRIITKDGTIKWIKDRVDFELNNKGKIISFNGVFEDFTEQYLIQSKLNESHEILENTLKTITEGFITLDNNWVYTYINPQAALMLEYRAEELIGKNIWDIDPEIIGTPFYNNCHLAFNTQKTIIYDEFYKPHKKWFENRIYPSKKGLSIFFQDITEQKILNDKIKEASNVINNSNSIAIVWENIPTWPIKYISENVSRILGYTVHEMLNEIIDFSVIMHPEDLDISNKEAIGFLNDTSVTYYKLSPYRVFTKDGRIRWVSERTTVKRNENGSPLELHGFIDDITDQYILENAINTILNSVSTITGNEYLKEITLQLCSVLNADYTFIGLLDNDNPLLVQTNLTCYQGQIIDNFSYNLKGTPCQEVLNLNACSYATHVAKLFPDDALLTEMEIEGYVGVPLIDSQKNVIGIIVGLFKNPLENTQFAESIIQLFATRTGAEIERLKTEDKLLKAEKAFAKKLLQVNKAVDAAKDVVFMTDINGVFTYVNSSFTALYGYSSEDLIGKTTPRILKSGLLPNEVYNNLWKSLYNKKPVNLELKNKHKNGQLIDVESTLSSVIDKDNEIVGFIAIQRDITARLKALKTNEILLNITKKIPEVGHIAQFSKTIKKELSSIIDTSNFYLALYNEKTDKLTIPYISDDKVKEYQSYSEFDAKGSLTGYLINHRKPLKIKRNDARQLEKEGKIKLIGPDSAVWLGVPLINHNKVIGALAVQSYENENAFTDQDLKVLEIIAEQVAIAIERIQNRLAINSNEQKFRSIFELSPDMVNLLDLEGNVIDCNQKLVTQLGYNSKEELIGKNYLKRFSSDQADLIKSIFNDLIISGNVLNYELVMTRKDGSTFPVEVSAVLNYDENNLPKNIIGIGRDITQRKLHENAMAEALEKARQADRLKSAFLANMSHEIRTPMNGIIGFAEMLKDPKLTEEKRSFYSNIIMNSSKQLLSIINDVLDMSTIEAGLAKLNFEAVDLNNMIVELHAFFSQKSDEKGLELNYKLPLENHLAIIETDATKLQQILTNLINNAIKFTKIGKVDISYRLKENMLEFCVADTGKGIEKKYHEDIFERFKQVNQEYTKETIGNGLGLSICKRFVELLGGKIWLTSEINKGSNFYFTIPYINVEKDKQPENIEKITIETEITTTMNKEITILVAEDEEYNQIFIEEILDDLEIKLLFAENGVEAVELAKNNPEIKFILMDIKMPVMNGIEASKKIKEFNNTVPIIALTAFSMESDKKYLLSEGFEDYLAKPIVKKDLIQILNKFGSK
ncbi:MAG: PAS domain S-box protein [Bacteroidetes bacterium]|nr:PAS domain S-box protein [Bacteroidota bacterium]